MDDKEYRQSTNQIFPDSEFALCAQRIADSLNRLLDKYPISGEDALSACNEIAEQTQIAFQLGSCFGYKRCAIDMGAISVEDAAAIQVKVKEVRKDG